MAQNHSVLNVYHTNIPTDYYSTDFLADKFLPMNIIMGVNNVVSINDDFKVQIRTDDMPLQNTVSFAIEEGTENLYTEVQEGMHPSFFGGLKSVKIYITQTEPQYILYHSYFTQLQNTFVTFSFYYCSYVQSQEAYINIDGTDVLLDNLINDGKWHRFVATVRMDDVRFDHVRVQQSGNLGDIFYYTMPQVEFKPYASTFTRKSESDMQMNITLDGIKTWAEKKMTDNLFTNSSFQTDDESGFNFIENWATRYIVNDPFMGKCIDLVDDKSGGSNSGCKYGIAVPASEGERCIFSVYINVLEASNEGAVELYFWWRDKDGNILRQDRSEVLGYEVPSDYVGQGWKRYEIVSTAPKDTVEVCAFVYSSMYMTSHIRATNFYLQKQIGTVGLGNIPSLKNKFISFWFKVPKFMQQELEDQFANGTTWNILTNYKSDYMQPSQFAVRIKPVLEDSVYKPKIELLVQEGTYTSTDNGDYINYTTTTVENIVFENEWAHMCLAFPGSENSIVWYINGQQIALNAQTTQVQTVIEDIAQKLYFGGKRSLLVSSIYAQEIDENTDLDALQSEFYNATDQHQLLKKEPVNLILLR